MSQLNLSQMLQQVKDPALRLLFQQVEEGINNIGDHIAVDPVGKPSPPPAIQGVNVKVSGELAHVTIQDNNPIRKGVNYFVEYDTDPSFPQPHIEHLGASRGRVLNLPARTDGDEAQTYYVRGYSGYQGSDPGPKIAHGGNNAPTPVSPTGATTLTLLPSTGSGTAAADGRQGGQGFGVVQTRGPIRPKRSVSQ